MKIMHLSDLHLGKKLKDISFLPDQAYILNQIVEIAKRQKPDCILIAGDIYDRSVPSEEAVSMLDCFLQQLSAARFPVLLISGNHDSAERIGFGASFMRLSGIYVSPAYGDGTIKPVTLTDEFGEVNFYLLPFIRPSTVRAAFPDESIESFADSVRSAIMHMQIDIAARNVLVAHQMVEKCEMSGSESILVGTLEHVDKSVFSCFDFTALGHIHRAQTFCEGRICYAGAPLKYSRREIPYEKTVTFTTLRRKGEPLLTETVALHPLHEMRVVTGCFEEVIQAEPSEDYIFADLTDAVPVINAMSRLRARFPNTLSLDFPNAYAYRQEEGAWTAAKDIESKSPHELLFDFFRAADLELDEEMKKHAVSMIEAAEKKPRQKKEG